MQRAELKEILQCLPEYKTRFYYFKDRYALLLLNLAVTGQISKKELKQTPFSKLLDKGVVQAVLSQNRGRLLSPEDFAAYWPAQYECYFLTLGVWGSLRNVCNQTSRRGFNLVLHLNFSSQHDEPYRKLIDPRDDRPFELGGHPVANGELHTLAWSRMDIDLDAGEALIEEIQTDWIREAQWERRYAARERDSYWCWWDSNPRNKWIIRYVDSILRIHEKMWDEAMLSATLWFLRDELGIRKIYYHTYRSGADLKRISGRLPPRSLYTKLPKQFCFSETDEVPGLLRKNVRSVSRIKKLEAARFNALIL